MVSVVSGKKIKKVGYGFCPFCRDRYDVFEDIDGIMEDIYCKCGSTGKQSYQGIGWHQTIEWEKKIFNTRGGINLQ